MGPRRGAADPLLYEPVGALEHRVPFPLHAGAARGVEAAPAADKDGEDRVKVGGRDEAEKNQSNMLRRSKKTDHFYGPLFELELVEALLVYEDVWHVGALEVEGDEEGGVRPAGGRAGVGQLRMCSAKSRLFQDNTT